MQALICRTPHLLEIVDRPAPKKPEPEWVRVGVGSVGICGTDYHIYEGKHPFLNYPRVMGHEVSGTVLEIGDGVDLKVGLRVIVNPYLSCGKCIACRKGKPNCCMSIQVLGVHTDGAMCEEILVPARNLYPINDLSLEAACTVEFLAIGAHAVRRANMGKETRALVIGAGPIGLGTALFSRIAGHDVTIMDTSEERLTVARDTFSFGSTLLANEETSAAVSRQTNGDGYDLVFDATGYAPSMEKAFSYVAHGGTLVFVSVVKDAITFADPEFHKREMTLIGSRNATQVDFEHVVESIRNGSVPVEKLITYRTTLTEAVVDLPRWAKDKTGLIKAVIKIGS